MSTNPSDDDFLAYSLSDLLTSLGELALVSSWLPSAVEAYGVNGEVLEAYSDKQQSIKGDELLYIVMSIDNIADGYFSAFRNNETEPWLVVRAIDNSIYKYMSTQPLPRYFKPSRIKPSATPGTSSPVRSVNAMKRFFLAINDNGAALSELLKQMQMKGSSTENFIILLADEKKNYYIQVTPCHGDSSWLYAEAVGNDNLDAKYVLQPGQIEQMRKLGWTKPTETPNFGRTCPSTNDGERRFIARTIKQTFTKVYGMPPGQEILVEMSTPDTSTLPIESQPTQNSWDPVVYAEGMKKSTSPVSAFFLIDSLDAIPRCIQWLALLKPYRLSSMEHSRYFKDVREIYESGRDVINFDHDFELFWENRKLQGLLRCHFLDKGRYEIELWLPGVIANDVADQFRDGHEGFFCAFMPPLFYD
ncbi:MAG: TY-Chap domain-containing protein [Chloroflexota bacterium]